MRASGLAISLVLAVAASCRAGSTTTTTNVGSSPASPAPAEATKDAAADAARTPLRDVHHVIVTGQSLAIGTMGIPPLTKEQPYANLMFDTGVMPGDDTPKKLVPLVEGDIIPGRVYRVETLASALANLVTMTAREQLSLEHTMLVSIHGAGATTYAGLKKGTPIYGNALLAVKTARDLAREEKKSYVVPAIVNVHGESDHVERTARYEEYLLDWQRDLEKDIQELTGQTDPIPFLTTQMSSFTRYGDATSRIPHAQLSAHVKANGKVVLVGPRYHLPYGNDGIHLSNEGYRHLGEDYAKVYKRVVLEGRPWEPVRPREITRAGATITIRFHVPSPPLVLDTTGVSNPGDYGFAYVDDEPSPPKIASVALTSADTIAITLSSSPDGRKGQRVRYAFSGTPRAAAGPTSGARGNLRDSDATPSRANPQKTSPASHLYNWCVHFEERVPDPS